MKEIMYPLISLVILVFVIFISVFWVDRTKNDSAESEFHARDRYAVAERLTKR